MASGDTKTEALLDILGNGGDPTPYVGCCNTKTQNYIIDAIDRINNVEQEVEEIKNNPDVADIVATYAELQSYDTSKLTDKDVIRVLADETHDGDSTYYRYSTSTGTFTYIGESKQYTDFVGTDGTAAGTAGLVPAPATTDAGKFLKADGTWGTVSAGPTVVQTTGTSQTDVMSQRAVTSMVYPDPTLQYEVRIGSDASASGSNSIAIGRSAKHTNPNDPAPAGSTPIATIAIGSECAANNDRSIALGNRALAYYKGSIAIGAYSKPLSVGEMNIGSSNTSYGYNSSNYRLLTGVYDGSSAHDAATYGQMNTRLGGLTLLSISQTDYDNLQTYDPDTLYIITGA